MCLSENKAYLCILITHNAQAMTKKILLVICLIGTLAFCACNKDDGKMDCTIYWQLYHTPKYLTDDTLEQIYKETFYGFWTPLNDNSVIAREVTQKDVRSLTLKLCTMANNKITESRDPQEIDNVEMRVYIDFAGKYIEEVWNKTY